MFCTVLNFSLRQRFQVDLDFQLKTKGYYTFFIIKEPSFCQERSTKETYFQIHGFFNYLQISSGMAVCSETY